ncbi:hypothetical protein E2P81_ATG03820 [Venturia nashicola]|uniref:Cryptic loci regulator 2 N-terminal domain-containing protein n=1 Tax=Venturia nashicola TaxID=86259 RepID=A0A4Z1P9V5_9PEZI|nr:hypothetical protein E6O75_ATG03910 [Venturia nashicola]TLD38145.1 hypothetical protein E2P81_ATG03820 [Venturia nashicola]
MTLFHVIWLARSDGKLDIRGKNALWEKNEPTSKQLDQTPDAKGVSDYYRFTSLNETKHLDWRRKLAGMLARELGYSLDKSYILHHLPENYRLYEHVKSKATDSDGKPAKNPKNHAGGGHDRQDAYLYGHPLGRKKRFRSPADFFPHLLWLVTDSKADPKNCSCKICSPDELQPVQPDTPKPTEPAKDVKPIVKQEDTSMRPMVHRNPVVEIPTQAPSNSQIRRPTSTGPPAAAPHPPQISSPAPQPSRPSPLAQPRSPDHQIDLAFGRFTFRPGELIWYNRGVAWGLAVILRRWIVGPPPSNRAYIVQPLTEPHNWDTAKVVDSEDDIRPWLAWSPPGYCHAALNHIPGLSYETADWEGIRTGLFGDPSKDMLTIDASILAGKSIDSSYTPFDFLRTAPNSEAGSETFWNGVYLGGEKLWLGDPVRLRITTGTAAENVLVVSSIIEKTISSYAAAKTTKVTLRGDIYTCANMTPPGQPPPQSQDTRTIPERMLEDLRQRNRASAAAAATSPSPQNPNPRTFYWKLLGTNSTVALADIKGRWYESSIMLPIVNTREGYLNSIKDGKIESVDVYLNARSECNRSDGIRKERREDAFGAAVPPSARVVDGFTVAPTMPERPSSAPDFQEDAVMHDAGNGLVDDFLNLDGMDGGFQGGVGGIGGGYSGQGEYFR